MCGKKPKEDTEKSFSKNKDKGGTQEKCPLAKLSVIVETSKKKPVGLAKVKLFQAKTEKGQGQTKEKTGLHDFGKVKPGDYIVTAEKDWHLTTDSKEQANVSVALAEGDDKEVKMILDPIEIHMYLDADRDGTIDKDWKDNKKWEWGAGKKGAIILCNNDKDNTDSGKKVDNSNKKIDTAADLPDIAPLVLEKEPTGRTIPKSWKVVLGVSDKTMIRIFDKRTDAGKPKIGPKTGDSYEIIDLHNNDKIVLGMEATKYPMDPDPSKDDGLITLELALKNDKDKTVYTEEAKVRVAPWLVSNHLGKTEEVYVVRIGGNNDFINELTTAVQAGSGLSPPTETSNFQVWVQDAMEIGHSSMPRQGSKDQWGTTVALRTPNRRIPGIGGYARNHFLGPNRGYVSLMKPRTMVISRDSFGNLECSPRVTMKDGTEYKFGRIIYGGVGPRPMRKRVRDFLKAQKVQKPIEVNTNWLAVGHVDEFMSFCPAKDRKKKFALVLASPILAWQILEKVKTDGHGNSEMFVGIAKGYGYDPRRVKDFLAIPWWKRVQKEVQEKIDKNQDILCTELNLDPTSDIIKLPVLFVRNTPRTRSRHIGYNPNSVNMLVVTKADGTANLVVPKPFGPVVGGKCQFEEYIRPKLESLGNTVYFVDDFKTYHQQMGEIHCGTNTRRKPPTDKWWWEQEAF